MISTYLQNRNGHYHLRLRIPADLSGLLPITEIVKSLKTSDFKIAKASAAPYLFTVTKTFSLLRAGFITAEDAQKSLYDLFGKRGRCKPDQETVAEGKKKVVPLTLSQGISTLLAVKEREWTPKTMMETQGVFRLIVDLIGDVPVRTITRNEVRDLRAKLLVLPANIYKVHSQVSPLHVHELIQSGQLTVTPMSLTTVNKHIARLSTLMLYCMREGVREDNPASGMRIRRKTRPDEERKAYNSEDMKNIRCNLPVDVATPERFWIPLICMLNGLRLDEACQLYKEDILEVEGVWSFDINCAKDKKLKNAASKRVIPIHPALIKKGFLTHVESCIDGGRLWENLKRCNINGYSNGFGKWYQRFNRRYVSKDPLKTFHSLRHSFANTLKQNGEQEAIIAELFCLSRKWTFRPPELMECQRSLKG